MGLGPNVKVIGPTFYFRSNRNVMFQVGLLLGPWCVDWTFSVKGKLNIDNILKAYKLTTIGGRNNSLLVQINKNS